MYFAADSRIAAALPTGEHAKMGGCFNSDGSMGASSFAASLTDATDRELELLLDLLRLSRATVLFAESGADKSGYLRERVVPRLTGPAAEPGDVCVLFDRWDARPLQDLLLQVHSQLGAKGALERPRGDALTPFSLAGTLGSWQRKLGVTLLLIFDQFEKHLAAPADRPETQEFDRALMLLMNTPELGAHFLLAVDEEAAPLLARLQERIPGLGDASLRLPASVAPLVPTTPPKPSAASRALHPAVLPDESPAVASPAPPDSLQGSPRRGSTLEGNAEPVGHEPELPHISSLEPRPALHGTPPSTTGSDIVDTAEARNAAPTAVVAAQHTQDPAMLRAHTEEPVVGAGGVVTGSIRDADGDAAASSPLSTAETQGRIETRPVPEAVRGTAWRLHPEHSLEAPATDAPRAAAEIAPATRRRAAVVTLGLALLVILSLALFARWQPDRASGAQQGDERETRSAASAPVPDAQSSAVEPPPASPADDQTPFRTPEADTQQHESSRSLPPDAARGATRERGQEVAQAQRPAPKPAASAPAARPERAALTGAVPFAVYIHVRDEAQRNQAESLIGPLARRGIRVTGIKLVNAGPAATDLRYFHPNDARGSAELVRALRDVGLAPARVKRISGFEGRATPGQYELWLGSDGPP